MYCYMHVLYTSCVWRQGRTNLPPEKVPWDALRTLMADCIYGGKIDNDFDQVTTPDCYVREVVSSSPDRGTIVGRVFSPTRQLVRFSHLPFKILNLFGILSPWGSSNYRPSAPFLYERSTTTSTR